MSLRIATVVLFACVSIAASGCAWSKPDCPFAGTDWAPDLDRASVDEWLDANVPVGTTKERAIEVLSEVGLTCHVEGDVIECRFLYPVDGTMERVHNLRIQLQDEKVFERTVAINPHAGVI